MDEQKSEALRIAERREFLKKAGRVAVAAPIAVVILAAETKRAPAQVVSGLVTNG